MHIEYKVGDKLFVDFAGKKLTVSEPRRDVRPEVESFVAVLGSQPARLSSGSRDAAEARPDSCQRGRLGQSVGCRRRSYRTA